MTETERIELLKAVAACAPKEMGAAFCYVGPMIETPCTSNYTPNAVSFGAATLWLKDDIEDAPAIIAMLDAMKKAPNACFFTLYIGSVITCEIAIDEVVSIIQCRAPTIAEAVARAFVQVFGGKE